MKSTILCYHKVGTGAEEGRRLNIEPKLLGQHVRFFARKRFKFKLIREVPAGTNPSTVFLTFDDAYRSTLENVPPILKEFDAKATFYAVGERIGLDSDWDGELARPLAGLDLLQEALKSGHEIGNHSSTHPHLNQMTIEAQTDELSRCHQHLMSSGIECQTVCYPYGSYNSDTLAAVKKLGYIAGVSLKKGTLPKDVGLLELPRIAIGYGDQLPKLIYKIQIRPWLRKIGL